MRGEVGARAEFEPVVLFVTAESPISQSPGTTLGTGPAIARIVRPLLQPDKLLTVPSSASNRIDQRRCDIMRYHPSPCGRANARHLCLWLAVLAAPEDR